MPNHKKAPPVRMLSALVFFVFLLSVVVGSEAAGHKKSFSAQSKSWKEQVTRHRSSTVRRAYQKHLGLKKTPGDKGECQYDHTKPLKYGGKDEVGNLALICGPVLKAKEKAERNKQTWELWEQQCLPH